MTHMLELAGQSWKPRGHSELSFSLHHSSTGFPTDIQFMLDTQFVPPWLDNEEIEPEHRTLYLELAGWFPGLRDWRDLSDYDLVAREAIDAGSGPVLPEQQGPDVRIWSHGPPGGIHTHAEDFWETRLVLGQRNEYAFPYELTAFHPTERARKAYLAQWSHEALDQPLPEDWQPEWVHEGWSLNYRGRLRFDVIMCMVPINTPQPIEWAQNLARRKLQVTEFGFCDVNGGDQWTGAFQPADGVMSNGRLVMLHTPTQFFYEWQARQQQKKQAPPSPPA